MPKGNPWEPHYQPAPAPPGCCDHQMRQQKVPPTLGNQFTVNEIYKMLFTNNSLVAMCSVGFSLPCCFPHSVSQEREEMPSAAQGPGQTPPTETSQQVGAAAEETLDPTTPTTFPETDLNVKKFTILWRTNISPIGQV